MSTGWYCDNCGIFHEEVHLVTKITLEFQPRDYANPMTLCSLGCLDESREDLNDQAAWASEHDASSPKFVRRLVEEPLVE